MKPILKTITGLGAGALIAGAGIGVYFATQNSTKQERIVYELKDETKLTVVNTDGISDTALKFFKQMVESQQFSGSEESMLTKIIIGPGTRPKNNGEYIDGVIKINSKVIQKRHKFNNPFDLAYYLYQIYSHEYLHFVADMYLTNISNKSDSYNSVFLKKFKELLHYDKHTIKYSSSLIQPGFKSIGSVYDAKDIYDFANGASSNLKNEHFKEVSILKPGLNLEYKYVLKDGSNKLIMSPLNPVFQVNSKHEMTKKTLKYIFGIDELFARKYMLINTQYHPTLNNNKNSIQGFRPDGFMNHKDYNDEFSTSSSPYIEDVFNFRRSLNSPDGVYLKDDPYAAKVGLEKLYSRIIGNTPNTIMNVKAFEGKEGISGNAMIQTTNGKAELKASPYKWIGFDDAKSTVITYYPITTKRKVQVMGDGTFTVRDTFFTDHKLPTDTSKKTLFLYKTKGDATRQELFPKDHFA